MKNQIKPQYVRLLSYNNACNLIDFIKKNDKTDYASITTGGVYIQVQDKNWNNVIDFLESLNMPYEINSEAPYKTEEKIIANLKANGTI